MEISVSYASVDGYRTARRFKTIGGARRFAHEFVGEHPEMGSFYAVSGDGVGKVTVQGCTIADLFPMGAFALTQNETIKAIRDLGLSCTVVDGEFRVNERKGTEATAYYTIAREDALDTARLIARNLTGGAA